MLALAAGCASRSAAVPPPRPDDLARTERTNPAATAKPVRSLQADMYAVFGAPIMAHAQWAVVVRSLDTGDALFELNADKLMMPASNMKIVTLAAAAHVLGWDHQFTTTLETSAPVADGVLRGDLIVRGGGDPTISSRGGRANAIFDQWAAALKAAGVTSISGRIVGDDGAFDDEGLGAGWAWDYLQYGYAAPVGALQYNESVAELTVHPGARAGDPAQVQLAAGTGLTVLNRAATAPPNVPENIEFRRHLDRPVLEITGTTPLPPQAADPSLTPVRNVSRQVAVVNPTQYFAQSLKDALVFRGIHVLREAVDLDDLEASDPEAAADPAQRRVLAATVSPPLREIAGVLMKVSQNQYAETLLKAMGAKASGTGTLQGGRAEVLRTLKEWRMDPQALVLADGSGLSRYNYLTASLLTGLLQRMYSDRTHCAAFLASLPAAGRDGTVATRMRRTRAEGNALVKTGSISNARSLSGYVRTRDGEMLVFSMLANDFIIPAAMVNWIADLGVEVLANFTRGSAARTVTVAPAARCPDGAAASAAAVSHR